MLNQNSFILKNKPIFSFICLASIVGVVLFLFPEIDLKISGIFFSPERKSFLGDDPILNFLHNSVYYITICLAVLWIFLLVLNVLKGREFFGLDKIRLVYLIAALIVGPGLVVNFIFKDHWGRARPSQIEEFGGTKKFTPPFVIADQCESNCSFVSGDPSVGFYFFAIALAIPKRQKLFTISSLALGGLFGSARIMMGAHFFSDVIFSGVFTFFSCYLLHVAMMKWCRQDESNIRPRHYQ